MKTTQMIQLRKKKSSILNAEIIKGAQCGKEIVFKRDKISKKNEKRI